jgi:hypothetical protein
VAAAVAAAAAAADVASAAQIMAGKAQLWRERSKYEAKGVLMNKGTVEMRARTTPPSARMSDEAKRSEGLGIVFPVTLTGSAFSAFGDPTLARSIASWKKNSLKRLLTLAC